MDLHIINDTKNWIFDFDGTLIDSAPSVKLCYEKVTKNIAPQRIDVVKKLQIGPTLAETAKEILGIEFLHKHEDFVSQFKYEYDQILLSQTNAYKGVNEMLNELKSRGNKIAIATNKRKGPTLKIIEHLDWGDYFSWIACVNPESKSIKNKSELVRSILTNEIDFQKSFFVGDTLNDALCAKENKLKFIKASYGYSEKKGWGDFTIYQDILNPINILDI
jgi:phosphoglycolate phosphatase